MRMSRGLFSCLICLACLLSACQPSPDSSVKGFYSQNQQVKGGKSYKGQRVTIAQIELLQGEDGQQGNVGQNDLILRFVGDNDTRFATPPLYTLQCLTQPARLLVRISGLSSISTSLSAPSALVSGFLQTQNNDEAVFIFALRSDFVYQVIEEESALRIKLLPVASQGEGAYHVILDAFDAFDESAGLPAEEGMSPALCEDGVTPIMISTPYENEDKAKEAAARLQGVLQGRQPSVAYLAYGALPSPPVILPGNLAQDVVFQPTIGKSSVSVYAVGSRFLASLSGERTLLARPAALGGEQLFICAADGKKQPLLEEPFARIGPVRVSKDGKWLALIEESDSARMLYLVQMETGQLRHLGEQVGSLTIGFDWGEDGKLYCMSGMGSVGLKSYDVTVPEDAETSPVQPLEEQEGETGTLETLSNAILFSDGEDTIYSLNPLEFERKVLTNGAQFVLSASKDKMAIIAYGNANEDEDIYDQLRVRTMGDKQEKVISDGRPVTQCVFSSDGSKLYYLLQQFNNEQYPYELMVASLDTGIARSVGLLKQATIFAGSSPDALFFTCGQPQGDQYVSAVYTLSIID